MQINSLTDRHCWVCCRSLRTTVISQNSFWLYTLLTTFVILMVQGRGRSMLVFGSGALACTLLQNGGGLSAKVSWVSGPHETQTLKACWMLFCVCPLIHFSLALWLCCWILLPSCIILWLLYFFHYWLFGMIHKQYCKTLEHVSRRIILSFLFLFCFSELSFFWRNSSTFQFIFSHALTSSLLTCVFRVICMCDACGGKEKPMRPSEWERHTGCRKKKWKESIRVKNPDQPLVSWVSHLLLCLQLRMVLWLEWLRLTWWFLHMVEMPFLYVIFSSHYAEGEKASAKGIEIGNVNYSFFGRNSDAASANVGCWSYWTCLWTTGHNCTSQATRAGSAISPRWWDQESWTCCWMSSSPEGFQTVFFAPIK